MKTMIFLIMLLIISMLGEIVFKSTQRNFELNKLNYNWLYHKDSVKWHHSN